MLSVNLFYPDRSVPPAVLLRSAMPATPLCKGAGMPIMVVDGLGCRADAAEIIPMEPVWVISQAADH